MPYSYSIDPERQLASLKGEGRVTIEEIFETEMKMLEDPEWHSELRVLSDFSEAENRALSTNDLKRLIHNQEKWLPKMNETRIAIVAPTNLLYGLGRMWEMMATTKAKNREVEIKIFRTHQAALEWLDLDAVE